MLTTTSPSEELQRAGAATPALWPDSVMWFMKTLAQGAGGFIELRLHDPSTKKMSQHFYPAATPIRALNAALAAAETHDVFVGMTVRKCKRGRNEDALRSSFFWADLDAGDALLDRVPLKPSLIQDSGTPGHLHAFWQLEQPADLTDARQRADFQGALGGIQRACGSDNVADLARVLRVPGTLNWKNPSQPRVVAPIEFRP